MPGQEVSVGGTLLVTADKIDSVLLSSSSASGPIGDVEITSISSLSEPFPLSSIANDVSTVSSVVLLARQTGNSQTKSSWSVST